MQSETSLTEAGIVSLKSQTGACNEQLFEVENQLSIREAELSQLQPKLADEAGHTETLINKVCTGAINFAIISNVCWLQSASVLSLFVTRFISYSSNVNNSLQDDQQ